MRERLKWRQNERINGWNIKSEKWVSETHQANVIEMAWSTEDWLMEKTIKVKDSRCRKTKLKCLDDVALPCSWCAVQTAETGQRVHGNSLCRAFKKHLKPGIWMDGKHRRVATGTHACTQSSYNDRVSRPGKGLIPCDYFTLVNCCICRHGKARVGLL